MSALLLDRIGIILTLVGTLLVAPEVLERVFGRQRIEWLGREIEGLFQGVHRRARKTLAAIIEEEMRLTLWVRAWIPTHVPVKLASLPDIGRIGGATILYSFLPLTGLALATVTSIDWFYLMLIPSAMVALDVLYLLVRLHVRALRAARPSRISLISVTFALFTFTLVYPLTSGIFAVISMLYLPALLVHSLMGRILLFVFKPGRPRLVVFSVGLAPFLAGQALQFAATFGH